MKRRVQKGRGSRHTAAQRDASLKHQKPEGDPPGVSGRGAHLTSLTAGCGRYVSLLRRYTGWRCSGVLCPPI
ncbi:hypothetical protein EYF80_061291 [Liparis tanakae]|uniref:Uncharacterized protein n=1 Tax=Liparis tanakae TaxID=230148 RepID=A0A4Z2EID1_9TELE|nr:hypothetical protein EYF80_061291 [Liparis tanakae]